MTQDKNMFMNDQAVGAIMLALQKSLMEQSDIVPTLKEFKFRFSKDGLMIMNPPIIKFDEDFEEKNNIDGFDVAGNQPE